MSTKYVFVSGGVASSLGKGIISASLAKLLQARGLRVTIQKFDPYINIDPGTLNPYEHGECYVTDDGAETDLDLGHYERFLGVHTSKANNVTTGKIYHTVISREREGAYLGKTVQIIPHITDEIKRRMLLLGKTGKYDIIITEIGGTVGDMESQPFVEAVRQLQWELPEEDCVTIHLTLVPYLSAAKELKTKPTQHSVQMLQQSGVQPDIIVLFRLRSLRLCPATPRRVGRLRPRRLDIHRVGVGLCVLRQISFKLDGAHRTGRRCRRSRRALLSPWPLSVPEGCCGALPDFMLARNAIT